MLFQLSETTIKTILGTIPKTLNKNFSNLQYLFTSVINFFKNIPIPDFSIFALFLYF